MFNEANTVEDFIRDLLSGSAARTMREARVSYGREQMAQASTGVGWTYIPSEQLPRTESDVLVEAQVREALIALNPEIAEKPDRADEVLYRLRAILLSVSSDGLVRANEEFTAWLRGERTMPFGLNNQHTTVRLIDFETIGRNHFVVTTQYTYRAGQTRRPDLVLLVNGLPLVIGECKTPVRPAVTWVDGAAQIQDDYEVNIPALFVPNVFSFATEGKTYRFGAIRMPLEIWAPWRDDSPLIVGEGPGVRSGGGSGLWKWS